MFWGLIVQPNKKYSKTVSTPFHVSQAVLDINSTTDSDVQLILKSDELEYILCILNKSKTAQVPLDLIFSEGDNISFRSVGGTVHLTGYLVDDQDYPDLGEADSSDGEEEAPELVPAEQEYENSGESGAEEDDDAEVEVEESDYEITQPPPAKVQKIHRMNGLANGLAKKEDKNKDNKHKKQHQPITNRNIRTLAGGVVIEELRQGQGASAKPGKKIQVYYEGRFKANNKIFDKTNTGKGFEFILGKNEVIKGWDIGIQGMKIGGKRRITCPPPMAYGAKGSPPAIPSNSTLIFDVVLRGVN
ncbi:46 kDa FK506-binding nuclear protein [Pseudolycoriella hygida]|uniref:peptidylprolyl isomerase n=1 Tax=Pseudolycoriella hygida TaxID=35572 RepID=A0A9Q0MXC4_9DIPT|nr:46 kDa FK506-binding nuclear protein [Pseudolycoriella hygida]